MAQAVISRADCSRIVDGVLREYRMTRNDILSRRRDLRHCRARREIVKKLRRLDVPLKEIGHQIGRHHSTVLWYLGRTHQERPVTERTKWRGHAHA